jgi:uncharacterized membrane protein YfbV (UPF0208 family)
LDNRTTASSDFERAVVKAFWRKVITWFKRENNQLLPYDEVRARIPIRGQHYIGFQQVPVEKIVGSLGRYRDFDRAFLPIQTKTRSRWMDIDIAHLKQVTLPPVDLFKIGDVYFVKDGNHRVSVARQRGQMYIDAYVTEVDVPVPFTADITVDDLAVKQAYADFLMKTKLDQLRPDANLETHIPGQYKLLLEHISVHQWYLGQERKAEVPFSEAVTSWYDNVYMPVIEILRQQGILHAFPNFAEVDLYLWVMEYQAYLRETYREEIVSEEMPGIDMQEVAREEAGLQFAEENPQLPVNKLINVFKKATGLDDLVLRQERAGFLQKTNLLELRPDAKIETSMLGLYERLLEHINAHRWYLGEQRHSPVSFEEAVVSWYDNVYMPLVRIIRKGGILKEFPGRTETELYMWIITRQWFLRQVTGNLALVKPIAGEADEDIRS